MYYMFIFFFFKQKTAYEMRISDWSSDVCSSDLSEDLGSGFYRVILRYGFMQDPDVPAALTGYDICGAKFKMMDTSFFLARQTLLPSSRPGMAVWREKLFAWMLRNEIGRAHV